MREEKITEYIPRTRPREPFRDYEFEKYKEDVKNIDKLTSGFSLIDWSILGVCKIYGDQPDRLLKYTIKYKLDIDVKDWKLEIYKKVIKTCQ